MTTDFEISDQGSIIVITPMTEAAQQWFYDNIEAEGWQYMGNSLCVDHRLADNILCGIADDGLTIQ